MLNIESVDLEACMLRVSSRTRRECRGTYGMPFANIARTGPA